MPSPLSPCIKGFTPPSSAPNLPLTTTTTMSYNAPTPSSPLSLTSSIVDDTSRPSSTRPKAGWGSPSPAPNSFPPISLATIPTPIHSVSIPLYAHTLRDDFPTPKILKNSPTTSAPPRSLSPSTLFSTLVPPFMPSDALILRTHIFASCPPTSPPPPNRPSFPASFVRYTWRLRDPS